MGADFRLMIVDRAVMAAFEVRWTVTAPTKPPEGLLLPQVVLSPFWAAYPTLGRGPVNGSQVLRAT